MIKDIKQITYVCIIITVVLFIVGWLVIYPNSVNSLDTKTSYYIEIADILFSMAGIFAFTKWFKIRFIKNLFLSRNEIIEKSFFYMSMYRLALWIFFSVVNILLWSFFDISNSLYLLALWAMLIVFILPTDSNISHNKEMMEC